MRSTLTAARPGIETTVPLLAAFVLVCAAEVVVGGMLWQRRRAGIALARATLRRAREA